MDVYADLEFPAAPSGRPYCFINMVATIDGKILSGGRDENVLDLGSKADHALMARIERAADAIIAGAQTLRASPKTWSPRAQVRIAVTRSGDLPFDARFFEDGDAYVAKAASAKFPVPGHVRVLQSGTETLDLELLFKQLREDLRIQRLLVLGGSELNAQLVAANLIDELFVTIAPKVKLGRDVPTYADGDPLPREELQRYRLIEHHVLGDEVFIRYRREPDDARQRP